MTRLLDIARAAAFAGICSGCIVWSAVAFAADDDALPRGTIALHAPISAPRGPSRTSNASYAMSLQASAPPNRATRSR